MKQEIKKANQTRDKSNKVMYSGNIRLKVENAEDYMQVNRFCETLKVLSNMSIVSNNWSEKEGLTITISLKQPIPLEDILMLLPMIDKIYKKKKDIIVVLNCYSPEIILPVLTNLEDRILAV